MPAESFEEFCRRRIESGPTPGDLNPWGDGLPGEWQGKRRRRAQRPHTDFEEQTSHARACLEVHAGLWAPELVDVKRVKDGRVDLLFRDQRGTALEVVLQGGEVVGVGTEREFRVRENAL